MPDRREWQGLRAQTRIEWGATPALAVSAGSMVIYLGVAEEAGLTVRQFTVTSGTALAVSAANYHTFKPFITKMVNGAGTVRYLGTARATNALGITANKPLRIHEEEFLNETIPQGAMLGVEIVTAGTPAPIRALLQARLFYAR